MTAGKAAVLSIDRMDGARVREIPTPEGVPLRFVLARVGDRASAFFIDCLIIVAIVIALLLLTVLASLASEGRGWVLSFGLLAMFIVRNFYFVWFELRWQGRTPGKRAMSLRVMDARGGPLSGEAVFARNLTRELEVFAPLTALLQPVLVWPGAPGWASLLAGVWLLLIAFMPLLNRDRLRVGDLIAGTTVVVAPKAALLADLGARTEPLNPTAPAQPAFQFTPEQLDLYGVYELQVLEDLLRSDSPDKHASLHSVSARIRAKIGWTGDGKTPDSERFLLEFYAAQRARLEHKMLLGRRQERKLSGKLGQRKPPPGRIK